MGAVVRVTQAEIAAAVGISQQAVAKWKLQDLELGAVAENLAERYPADKARDALMALLVQVGERCDRMEGERSSGRAALIEQVAYGKEIPELPDDEADKIIKSAADLGLARKRATEELIASGAHVPKEDVSSSTAQSTTPSAPPWATSSSTSCATTA